MPSPLQSLLALLQGNPVPLLGTGWNPDVKMTGVRPDFGLSTVTGISSQAKSPYERTLRPGETRSKDELRDMLAEVILAGGAGAAPLAGLSGRQMARQQMSAARVRPGAEKQFNEWFGGSQVVSEKGEPKTLYHGSSTSDFTAFSKEKASPGLYGRGFYFTSDPGIASEYSTIKGDRSASGVIPAHLAIKKPLNMEEFIPARDVRKVVESIWRQRDLDPNSKVEGHLRLTRRGKQVIGQGEEGNLDGRNFYAALDSMTYGNKDQITQALKDAGFDGIRHKGGRIVGNREHDVWVAFEPEQIKSATGNRGIYSRKSGDIRE